MATIHTGPGKKDQLVPVCAATVAGSLRAAGFTTSHVPGQGMAAWRWRGRYRIAIEPAIEGWAVSVVRVTGSHKHGVSRNQSSSLQAAALLAIAESTNVDLVLELFPSLITELRRAA